MKLYTKRGDLGDTDLFGGERVPKDHVRVAAYGDVDELNAGIGLALVAVPPGDTDWTSRLRHVQDLLFVLGSELATPRPRDSTPSVDESDIADLETWIDEACAQTPPLRNFVLPGGNELAARLHLARTVCRRAERQVITLARQTGDGVSVAPNTIVFLNRLSDLLFAWARLANVRGQTPEIVWHPRSKSRGAN